MPSTPLRTLPHQPLNPSESVHVYLNGVEQFEGTDWSWNAAANGVQVLAAMDAQPGDLLEIRYAHVGDAWHVISGWVPGDTFADLTVIEAGAIKRTGQSGTIETVAAPTYRQTGSVSLQWLLTLATALTGNEAIWFLARMYEVNLTTGALAQGLSSNATVTPASMTKTHTYTVTAGTGFDHFEIQFSADKTNPTDFGESGAVHTWYPAGHPSDPR